MGPVAFTAPGKPASWKRRITTVQRIGTKTRAKHFNDPEYYQNRAGMAGILLRAIGGANREWWQGQRIRLTLNVYFADRRVQDVDRVQNLVLDAGKGIVWKDDRWTTFEGGGLIAVPHYSKHEPRIDGLIEAMGPLWKAKK